MTERKPTHPGEVLFEDIIKPLGLTIKDAAFFLGISRKSLSEVIHGKCAVTPEMAYRIGIATDTTPESWLKMQGQLDLWNVKYSKKIEIKKFPIEKIA